MIATLRQTAAACAFTVLCSGRAVAQHEHAHMDSSATGPHGISVSADWKMAAMDKHMAYSATRPLKKDAEGRLVLTGAMYTASRRTSEDELDRRVPLSVARWHRHVNWCVPRRLDKDRWSETRDGRPLFGPLGVATRDECDAVGGRFIPQAFGWMVHANVFAGNDLRSIWHDDHMERGNAMLGAPKNPD